MERNSQNKISALAVGLLATAILAAGLLIMSLFLIPKLRGKSVAWNSDAPVSGESVCSTDAPAESEAAIMPTQLYPFESMEPSNAPTADASPLPTVAQETPETAEGTEAPSSTSPTQSDAPDTDEPVHTETALPHTAEPVTTPAQTDTPLPSQTPVMTAAPITTEPSQTDRPSNPLIRNRDISYVSRGKSVQATICVPEGNGPYPVLILLHGFMGDKDQLGGFRIIADALLDAGIASIRMDFAGCGSSSEGSEFFSLNTMKRDAQNAILYMKNHYAIDENRIGLLGFSLGGRAALEMVAEGLADPSVLFLISPAASTASFIDLLGGKANWQKMYEKAISDGYALFQGEKLGVEFFECFSAYENPTAQAKRRFSGRACVAYTRTDMAVPWSVSQNVADVLGCEVAAYETGGHACGLDQGRDGSILSRHIATIIRLLGQ